MLGIFFFPLTFTCLEMYCLISSSVISEPFDRTTKATGSSPVLSSFRLRWSNYASEIQIEWSRHWTQIKYNYTELIKSVSAYETTAASAMLGWVMSMASSSAGATWNPLYLMSSLSRSTMKISSSSSTYPTSPVCSHPSLSMVRSVASGSLRYPGPISFS